METKEGLTALIKEVIDTNPINHCADEGCNCIFCYCEPYDELHDSDCWLVRAAKAIGVEAPPHKG